MTQNVIVGYVHGDTLTQQFHHCLWNSFIYEAQGPNRILGLTARYSNGPISGARNQIVDQFLDTDAEWLWCLDADATFSPTMLTSLLASAHPEDCPVVGALAHMVRSRLDPNGREAVDLYGNAERDIIPTMYQRVCNGDGTWAGYREIAHYGRGLIEVDATGAHCLLVHRSVFEKIQNDYPNRWFRESEVAPGVPCGEDITFCLAARDLDIPIHVDTRLESGHVKPFVMTSLMATRK